MDVASLVIRVVNDGLDAATKGLQNLGQNAENAKGRVDNLNKNMEGLRNAALGAGAVLTGVLYKSINVAQEFESAMAEVKKTVDFESPKGIEDMRKGLEKLSTQIPQTFGELAATASNAGLLGVAEKDILGFTETVAKMGVAFDLQSDAVAESMAKIANVFQIPIKDIGNLGDVINHLSNNMASTAGEIIDFTKRTASLSATMGLSEDSTAAFGSAMIALGMPAEVAGTAFNAFLGKLANLDGLSKRGKAAFASMGLDATEFAKLMQNDAEAGILKFIETLRDVPKEMQAALAYDALGTELAPKVLAMAAGYEEVARALNMTGDAAGSMEKEFAAISDTSANKMVLFKNNIDLVWSSIGDALIPAFNDALDAMRPFIESMTDWVRENPELVQQILLITGAVTGFVLAASGIGIVASSFLAMVTPVGMVVAAVASLVGIGVALYQNWDMVKAKADEVWSDIVNLVNDNKVAFAALSAVMTSIVIGFVAVNAQAIAATAVFTTMRIATIAYNAVFAVTNGLMAAWAGAKLVASLAMIGARVVANTAIFVVHNTALVAMKVATLAWQAVLGVGKLIAMGAAVAANTVRLIAQTTALAAIRVATVAWSVASSAAAIGAKALGVAIRFMLGPIGIAITVIGALVTAGVYLYKNWDTVKAKATQVWSTVKTVIINSLKDLPAKLIKMGQDAVQGLINGIKSKIAGVKSAASELGQAAWGGVKSFLQIRSPSRKMAELGKNTAEGLAKGIKDNKKKAVSEAQKMAEQAVKAVKDTIATLQRDIALFGNDDPIAAMLWDRQNTDKYKGVGDALFNEAVGLTKRKKELEDNAKVADKLAAANKSIEDSIISMDRQLYELAAERNPYELLLWDLEHTKKYADAGAEAIELLKTKTKELFEEQERQAAIKKAKEASDAMSQMLGGLGGEQSPLQRLQDEQDERLRIIQESMIAEGGMKQAHTDALLAIDERYEQDLQKLKLAQYGDGLGLFTRFMGAMLGENKRAKRIMFGIEKGFALATILIENKKALAKAWASAPFPYNLPIVAKTAMQTGAISAALDAVNPKGFKSGGYTGSIGANNIAGVVHGNEYVFDAQSTKAIGVENLERIRRGKNTGEVNITVNNHSGAKVETETDSQGNIIMTIRDEVKRSWSNLQNPNSHESKMLGRNVQAPRRR